ncbi:RmlC-like cupin domain-containing protein [Mycena filopes]|nr:RmlC-like cupin domain-containing protein [Mycena filopes]
MGERGNADYGWLQTFHTFSAGSYQDAKHNQFGSLRIINEDRVAPHNGKDSMGNTEILKRGDIQLTSAGTGISHSEGAYGDKQVHFLQIWSLPSVARLQPRYFTRHFTDAEKRDVWACVVAPVGAEGVQKDNREGTGPAPVQSSLTLYATLLSDGKSLRQTIKGSKGYIHVVQTSGFNTKAASSATIKVVSGAGVGTVLKEGDGAYLHFDNGGSELVVESVGDKTAEVLLFDIE